MIRDTINGLDKVIKGDIREGYVIIITGSAGTLKTVFTFSMMNGLLKNAKNKHGVFITLEENYQDHLWNMKSFNITPHPNLRVLDIANFKAILKNSGGYSIRDKEYPELVLKASFVDSGFPPDQIETPYCYALDSLNALLSLSRIEPEKKRELTQDLFYRLKEKKVTSFIIWQQTSRDIDEFFLADGVIELGIDRKNPRTPSRYMIVHKLKGVEHELGEFVIDVGKNGLEIISKR